MTSPQVRCQAGRRCDPRHALPGRSRSNYQNYLLCYGTELICQRDLESPPPVTVNFLASVPILQQKKEIFLTSRTEAVAQKDRRYWGEGHPENAQP